MIPLGSTLVPAGKLHIRVEKLHSGGIAPTYMLEAGEARHRRRKHLDRNEAVKELQP